LQDGKHGGANRLKAGWARVVDVNRADQWWEYKLLPALAIFYATAVLGDTPLSALWRPLAELLAALAIGATYVSLINDYTDRADDQRAGKPNRLLGLSPAVALLLIASSVALGAVMLWWFADRPFVFATYLAGWIAYSLYSLPPFRFKMRAALGAGADAIGAHIVPALLALFLVQAAIGAFPPPGWLLAVTTWSAAYGMRGIIWHQLLDEANDRRSGVETFVIRYPGKVLTLVRRILFPAEIIALIAMLVMIDAPVTVYALAAYAFFLIARLHRFEQQPAMVVSKPRSVFILNEYYEVFLPLALLAASASRHFADLWVLAGHIALFPRLVTRIVQDWNEVTR
jgi:hypothetical protein